MLKPRTEAFGAIFGRFCRLVGKGMIFGILDRLKAKYIFSGALLLLFLLPVLGMALPGGVQHPATPERQTPPDSTPTQAVQKSRRETRREIRRLQREADRPRPPKHVRKRSRIRFSTPGSTRSSGAPPLSPIAPADSTAPTGNDSLLRDSLRQDTTQRDTTRKNLSWTTSSAAKTRTRSTTTYATARSISTTRVISTTRT